MSNPLWALICSKDWEDSPDICGFFVEPPVDNEIDAVKTWHRHVEFFGEGHVKHMLMVPWTAEMESAATLNPKQDGSYSILGDDVPSLKSELTDKSIFKLPNNETLCRMLQVGPDEFSAASTPRSNGLTV